MEFSSANFMELTIKDVSDLLLGDISDDKKQAGALLYGHDQDGRRFWLRVVLSLDEELPKEPIGRCRCTIEPNIMRKVE